MFRSNQKSPAPYRRPPPRYSPPGCGDADRMDEPSRRTPFRPSGRSGPVGRSPRSGRGVIRDVTVRLLTAIPVESEGPDDRMPTSPPRSGLRADLLPGGLCRPHTRAVEQERKRSDRSRAKGSSNRMTHLREDYPTHRVVGYRAGRDPPDGDSSRSRPLNKRPPALKDPARRLRLIPRY
jgi:hypothetical protein